ncbi:MAG TPA: hypothetical protein VG475_16380, partial [Pseudolabrys sp.]|nr:hypothetical protein [Pseudolabrys sp.]
FELFARPITLRAEVLNFTRKLACHLARPKPGNGQTRSDWLSASCGRHGSSGYRHYLPVAVLDEFYTRADGQQWEAS